MKRKSPTNSRPWEDETLRREYMADKVCGICGELAEPHHIFVCGDTKWDLVSNIFPACRACHDSFHRTPTLSRVRLCYHKALGDELDAEEVDRAFGRSVWGWLQTDKVKAACVDKRSSHPEAMRRFLVDYLGEQNGE